MSDEERRVPTKLATAPALAAFVAGGAASFYFVPGMPGLFGAALCGLAIAVAVVDWRELIIPDGLNAAILGLGLLRAGLNSEDGAVLPALGDTLLCSAALGGILLFVRFVFGLRGREGLGLGDVKLGFAGGAWLSWATLPIVIEIAAMSALVVFLIVPKMIGRAPHWNMRLPFGSFLAPAVWIGWLIEALVRAP